MSDCCDNDTALNLIRGRQAGTLKSVLVINAVMFTKLRPKTAAPATRAESFRVMYFITPERAAAD